MSLVAEVGSTVLQALGDKTYEIMSQPTMRNSAREASLAFANNSEVLKVEPKLLQYCEEERRSSLSQASRARGRGECARC